MGGGSLGFGSSDSSSRQRVPKWQKEPLIDMYNMGENFLQGQSQQTINQMMGQGQNAIGQLNAISDTAQNPWQYMLQGGAQASSGGDVQDYLSGYMNKSPLDLGFNTANLGSSNFGSTDFGRANFGTADLSAMGGLGTMQNMQQDGINPYLSAMGQYSLGRMNDNFNRNVMPGINANAAFSGGLGGSRQGVAQGIAAGDLAGEQANYLSNLYGNQYQSDQARRLQAAGMESDAVARNQAMNLEQMQGLNANNLSQEQALNQMNLNQQQGLNELELNQQQGLNQLGLSQAQGLNEAMLGQQGQNLTQQQQQLAAAGMSQDMLANVDQNILNSLGMTGAMQGAAGASTGMLQGMNEAQWAPYLNYAGMLGSPTVLGQSDSSSWNIQGSGYGGAGG